CNCSTGSNLTDAGRDAAHAAPWAATPKSVFRCRWGGHAEGLRRRCGDAAGVELAASPVDRTVMNVGSDPSLPPAAVVGRCVVRRWRRVVAEVP
ncbi:MAG: hypothetical protein ACRDRB_16795, partial [Pseudonocardiaceae bacterium]